MTIKLPMEIKNNKLKFNINKSNKYIYNVYVNGKIYYEHTKQPEDIMLEENMYIECYVYKHNIEMPYFTYYVKKRDLVFINKLREEVETMDSIFKQINRSIGGKV